MIIHTKEGIPCMTIEVTILLSVISVCLTAFFGFSLYMRNKKADVKADVGEITTVTVSLENIKDLLKEIKLDMSNVKDDVRSEMELRIRLEESLKNAWERIKALEILISKKG